MARLSQEGLSRQSALLARARDLSQERRKASGKLKEAVEREIRDLRMAEARFDVNFAEPAGDGEGKSSLTAKGMDTVEFYLSTNVGEDLKPLNRIASGGELSRIILAMKKVLARMGSVDSIIFDEVDSGIGGATAEVVGGKLKDVSRHHQVFCITHLPQIACFGDRHYLVSKTVKGERTNSRVQLLSEPDRLQEITRMLGGVELTDRTVDHAKEMLKRAKKKRG
jgi:DNA repair protein RecN (Recombination protein N)